MSGADSSQPPLQWSLPWTQHVGAVPYSNSSMTIPPPPVTTSTALRQSSLQLANDGLPDERTRLDSTPLLTSTSTTPEPPRAIPSHNDANAPSPSQYPILLPSAPRPVSYSYPVDALTNGSCPVSATLDFSPLSVPWNAMQDHIQSIQLDVRVALSELRTIKTSQSNLVSRVGALEEALGVRQKKAQPKGKRGKGKGKTSYEPDKAQGASTSPGPPVANLLDRLAAIEFAVEELLERAENRGSTPVAHQAVGTSPSPAPALEHTTQSPTADCMMHQQLSPPRRPSQYEPIPILDPATTPYTSSSLPIPAVAPTKEYADASVQVLCSPSPQAPVCSIADYDCRTSFSFIPADWSFKGTINYSTSTGSSNEDSGGPASPYPPTAMDNVAGLSESFRSFEDKHRSSVINEPGVEAEDIASAAMNHTISTPTLDASAIGVEPEALSVTSSSMMDITAYGSTSVPGVPMEDARRGEVDDENILGPSSASLLAPSLVPPVEHPGASYGPTPSATRVTRHTSSSPSAAELAGPDGSAVEHAANSEELQQNTVGGDVFPRHSVPHSIREGSMDVESPGAPSVGLHTTSSTSSAPSAIIPPSIVHSPAPMEATLSGGQGLVGSLSDAQVQSSAESLTQPPAFPTDHGDEYASVEVYSQHEQDEEDVLRALVAITPATSRNSPSMAPQGDATVNHSDCAAASAQSVSLIGGVPLDVTGHDWHSTATPENGPSTSVSPLDVSTSQGAPALEELSSLTSIASTIDLSDTETSKENPPLSFTTGNHSGRLKRSRSGRGNRSRSLPRTVRTHVSHGVTSQVDEVSASSCVIGGPSASLSELTQLARRGASSTSLGNAGYSRSRKRKRLTARDALEDREITSSNSLNDHTTPCLGEVSGAIHPANPAEATDNFPLPIDGVGTHSLSGNIYPAERNEQSLACTKPVGTPLKIVIPASKRIKTEKSCTTVSGGAPETSKGPKRRSKARKSECGRGQSRYVLLDGKVVRIDAESRPSIDNTEQNTHYFSPGGIPNDVTGVLETSATASMVDWEGGRKSSAMEKPSFTRKLREPGAGTLTDFPDMPNHQRTVILPEWPELKSSSDEWGRQFIQCDNCDMWYHYGCVGVEMGDARLDPDAAFICPLCCVEPAKRQTLRNRTESCSRPGCVESAEAQDGLYFVERLVGRKAVGQAGYLWLAKWEGYPMIQATWIPEGNIVGCAENLFKQFESDAIQEGVDMDDDIVLLSVAVAAGWGE